MALRTHKFAGVTRRGIAVRESLHKIELNGDGEKYPKGLCRMIAEYDEYLPYVKFKFELLREARHSISNYQRLRRRRRGRNPFGSVERRIQRVRQSIIAAAYPPRQRIVMANNQPFNAANALFRRL